MRRFWIFAMSLTLLSSAACGDDDPVSPSATAPTFTTQLLPSNEVPPVTNADASASGNVSVVLHVNRDAAQNIMSATADFTVVMSGFPPNTSLTGAHIHNARVGQNAPVAVDTGITRGEITLADGSGRFDRNGIAVAPVLAQNMLNDPAGFYFNVHTPLNGGGAIRGQLNRIQ